MAQPQSLPPADGAAAARHAKRRLDELDAGRIAKHLVMFRPTEPDVVNLMAKAGQSIPGLTDAAEVLRVLRYNPDCMFAFARKSKFNPAAPVGEGFIAILPLTQLGAQNLALGTMDTLKPDVRLLAKQNERPAGIYFWCTFALGPLAGGIALLMEKLSTEQYAGLPIYTRNVTEDGRRFSRDLGLTEGMKVGDIETPNIWVFHREPHTPLYDSYVRGANKNKVGVTIARTFDDLTRAMAIRNAVYMGEQECPYEEEYDGNDLSATHLIAYIGDEPVGCLRLRFFADFAKLERMAIRKEFRKSRAAFQLIHAGMKFCQKKGYRRIYAHSQTRLVDFWNRFGFHAMEDGKKFIFSDFEYVEIVADVEPDPEAIALGADPYVIIRPEGRWHAPGVLEQSSVRPATQPSVVRVR